MGVGRASLPRLPRSFAIDAFTFAVTTPTRVRVEESTNLRDYLLSMLTTSGATSETNVHSLIINGPGKPVTDDAYGLGVDAGPSLERATFMNQTTDGPQ